MSFTESDIEEMIKEIKAAAKEEGYKFEGFYADENSLQNLISLNLLKEMYLFIQN